jgi:hypothetical protein
MTLRTNLSNGWGYQRQNSMKGISRVACSSEPETQFPLPLNLKLNNLTNCVVCWKLMKKTRNCQLIERRDKEKARSAGSGMVVIFFGVNIDGQSLLER